MGPLVLNTLAAFVGGQIEIQDPFDGISRGEIAEVTQDGDMVNIRFAWLAVGNSVPPTSWTSDPDSLEQSINATEYTMYGIGQGRLMVTSMLQGDSWVFFPSDGSKLDPAKVEGLEIEA